MLRLICIFIAFLVAAKGVVAFGSQGEHFEGTVYSVLDNSISDVWLCESEDNSERDEGDDTDSSLSPSQLPLSSTFGNHTLSLDNSIHSAPSIAWVNQHLFITYRCIRL